MRTLNIYNKLYFKLDQEKCTEVNVCMLKIFNKNYYKKPCLGGQQRF